MLLTAKSATYMHTSISIRESFETLIISIIISTKSTLNRHIPYKHARQLPNARRISANHITNSGWITSVAPVFMPQNPSVPPVSCEMLFSIRLDKLGHLVSCIFLTGSSAPNRDITWETFCHRDYWCEQGYFFLCFLRMRWWWILRKCFWKYG